MAAEPDLDHLCGGEKRVRRWDLGIAALAERQHGVVAYRQLLGLGLSPRQIDRRAAAGHLHRIHRGVYAVGHPKLSRQGWWMAAVLSGGPDSVLSHRAAGSEWQLRTWSGRPSITVPSWRATTSAIEIHTRSLPADEVTTLDAIPVTTVPRTLLDLATVLDRDQLLNAINEAEERQLRDRLSLPDMLERHRGERGTAKLRAVLAEVGYGVPRQALEELFARFVRERRLPPPELNSSVRVGDRSFSPDCLWRSARLIVELHSARHHGSGPKISRDATRDRRLLMAGWRVIHVTWAQLRSRREADELERDLRVALRIPTV